MDKTRHYVKWRNSDAKGYVIPFKNILKSRTTNRKWVSGCQALPEVRGGDPPQQGNEGTFWDDGIMTVEVITELSTFVRTRTWYLKRDEFYVNCTSLNKAVFLKGNWSTNTLPSPTIKRYILTFWRKSSVISELKAVLYWIRLPLNSWVIPSWFFSFHC